MAFTPVIDRINRNLSKFADGQKIRYLNINDKLADSDGMLRDGMMNAKDKLHPTVEAYQVWADALKPILTKLLGPPPLWIAPRRLRAIPPRELIFARPPAGIGLIRLIFVGRIAKVREQPLSRIVGMP